MTAPVNPRSLGIEAQYLPATVEDLATIKQRLLDAGSSPAEASGILGWLVDKAAGLPDLTSATTRAQYRKVLAELEPPSRPGPHRRRLRPAPKGGDLANAHNPRSRRSVKRALAAAGRAVGWAA